MFEIRNVHHVDHEMRAQLYSLEKACHKEDGTHQFTYFSNQYQFDLEMPWLFVAYQGEQILGFIHLYIEDPLCAEVTVKVLPHVRRQGVGSALINAAQEVMITYGIQQAVYVTENGFWSDKEAWRSLFYEDQEFAQEIIMTYDDSEMSIGGSTLVLSIANQEDGAWISKEKTKVFGRTLEESEQFVRTAMADADTKVFIFKSQTGEPVSSLCVDQSGPQNYIFSLFVSPKWQGRGFGKRMVQETVKQIKEENSCPILLQVESENLHARSLYKALGFKEISRVESVILSSSCGIPK